MSGDASCFVRGVIASIDGVFKKTQGVSKLMQSRGFDFWFFGFHFSSVFGPVFGIHLHPPMELASGSSKLFWNSVAILGKTATVANDDAIQGRTLTVLVIN